MRTLRNVKCLHELNPPEVWRIKRIANVFFNPPCCLADDGKTRKRLKEVGAMKFDIRIVTGIVLGMVLGLHYHEALLTYMPLLTIAGLVMLLKVLHR